MKATGWQACWAGAVAYLVGVEGVVGRIVACGVAGVLGWVVDCVVAGVVAGPGLVRVES